MTIQGPLHIDLTRIIAAAQERQAEREAAVAAKLRAELAEHAARRRDAMRAEIVHLCGLEIAALFSYHYDTERGFNGDTWAQIAHDGAIFRLQSSTWGGNTSWRIVRVSPTNSAALRVDFGYRQPDELNGDLLLCAISDAFNAPVLQCDESEDDDPDRHAAQQELEEAERLDRIEADLIANPF